MLIARLIADTDKLETRLKQAGLALASAGMSEGTQAGSRPVNGSKSVMQIRVPKGDMADLRTIVEEHFAPDAALLASASFEPVRLLVSDMDSTMIEQECIDELADFAGLKDKVSAITERAMQGELDFETALRERVGLLAGMPESKIAECLEKRITLVPGARSLVGTLKAMGCRTVLVTGGFHHFADPIAEQLGFDHVIGNRLAVANGKLTGELDGPVVDSGTKLSVLQEERAKLPSSKSIATGDGANDIPMLQAADYGIAYKAKPKAREAASGWIDEGDLTAVLTMLDVPLEKWAE
ncbi:phosphoserine phosphatase SerB [Pontixanthobacter aestiaquae]|uniref:Phosphoserine phosphatase n=1 Tax=Pontixanthobacter aestiaquae TaxID=1509367 RepID=A0A844Z9E8_9SPHN|nr:phosphoserine phosphatase SerB [Pontixanthobacter aestiaquae]MDN3645532.1 phosphoserine phosphatase SerB [Pontixanthobacter aestiaquae]MXO83470.1 phosphoserine phosphatase SerB [Pontixanthobacter aestiaquae]